MGNSTPIPARRVLFVAYYFPPMGLSGVQRVTKMVKYLAREGWDVDVLTVRPGGYFAFDETLLKDLDDPRIRIYRTGSLDPTRLFSSGSRVSLPNEGRRRLISTLSQLIFQPDNKIGWIPFAVRRGRELIADNDYSAVIASAPPYSALLAARSLAISAGIPLVADFRDDWMGNPRHTYPTALHRWFSARLERRVLDAADATLAINDTIARSLEERAPESNRVTVVPQGYDPEDFNRMITPADDPSDHGSDRPERRLFTLLYTGVFYDAQRPDTFLRALAGFTADNPDVSSHVRARFAGLFPDEARVLAAELGLSDNIEILGYLDHDDVVTELIDCDVAWFTIGHRPGAEGISTGKLFEYMGSGKPILALIPDGEAARALRGYGAVRICDPDSVEATAAAISEYHAEWERGRLPSGQSGHVRKYDRRRQGKMLSGLLESLGS